MHSSEESTVPLTVAPARPSSSLNVHHLIWLNLVSTAACTLVANQTRSRPLAEIKRLKQPLVISLLVLVDSCVLCLLQIFPQVCTHTVCLKAQSHHITQC